MKVYSIALFIFIVNMVIGLVNTLDLTVADYAPAQDKTAIINPEEAEKKIAGTVGENQNTFIASLNWLTENVYLAIQGIGAFISMLLNATIFSYDTYYSFLCYEGVDCTEFSSFMWKFAFGLSSITYLVYTVALIQLATGKNFPGME